MGVRQSIIVLALFILAGAPAARGELWFARPVVVHEWGVEAFDWSAGQSPAALASKVPGYMYIDTRPGDAAEVTGKRVKDFPRDSGMRLKPVLYFYPAPGFAMVPIGVEMRFAQGHATAWYPQVNVYRPSAGAATSQPASSDQSKDAAELAGTPSRLHVADDPSMQLAWYTLTLTKNLPAGVKLAGDHLPADNWAKLARNVPDAAYVSNGKEAEKYLFYEGQTHEQPAIALVPITEPGSPSDSGQVVNVSDRPIYDVFAIYHAGGHTWVGFIPALAPMPSGADTASGGVTAATLPLPDFTQSVPWTDPQSLYAATTGRLLSSLTQGGTLVGKAQLYRNPADPQGPTCSGRLFPDEAAALEKIWRHDFFDAGGDGELTIVYRQSPAALDADMPIDIYTDMHHYIGLSRCGLVVVSHIDPKLAREAYMKVQAGMIQGNRQVYDRAVEFLRADQGLADSILNYFQRINNSVEIQSMRKDVDAP